MKQLSKSILTLVCLALLAVFADMSCKKATEKQQDELMEKTIEKSAGEKADVDLEDKKLTIETEQGKTEYNVGANQWPSEAPKDVPEFKFGTIKGTSKTQTPDGDSWSVTYENLPADVMDKYEAELKKAGFTTHKVKINGNGNLTAEKGNLLVMAIFGEGKANISMRKAENE